MSSGGPWKELEGLWNVDRTENLDDYLKELGIGYLIRKLAGTIKGQLKITIEGDQITTQSLSSLVNQNPNTFIVNGPEAIANFDGKDAKARALWDDGKFILEIAPTEDGTITKAQKVTRYIENGELVQIMEAGNAKCTRHLTRA